MKLLKTENNIIEEIIYYLKEFDRLVYYFSFRTENKELHEIRDKLCTYIENDINSFVKAVKEYPTVFGISRLNINGLYDEINEIMKDYNGKEIKLLFCTKHIKAKLSKKIKIIMPSYYKNSYKNKHESFIKSVKEVLDSDLNINREEWEELYNRLLGKETLDDRLKRIEEKLDKLIGV